MQKTMAFNLAREADRSTISSSSGSGAGSNFRAGASSGSSSSSSSSALMLKSFLSIHFWSQGLLRSADANDAVTHEEKEDEDLLLCGVDGVGGVVGDGEREGCC